MHKNSTKHIFFYLTLNVFQTGGRQKVSKSDFQSEFSMSRIIRIFFPMKNTNVGAHFLLKLFFDYFYF